MTAPPPRRRWRSASRPGLPARRGSGRPRCRRGRARRRWRSRRGRFELGPRLGGRASRRIRFDDRAGIRRWRDIDQSASLAGRGRLSRIAGRRARRSGGRERRAGRSRCGPTRDAATVRSGRGRPARPTVGAARRLRHDDRHHDVEPEEQAPAHEHQDDPDDPDERRIEVEPLGDAAGDPCEHPLVARAVQAVVHRQPPAGSSSTLPAFAVIDRSILTLGEPEAGRSSRSIRLDRGPVHAKLFEPRTELDWIRTPAPAGTHRSRLAGVDRRRAGQLAAGSVIPVDPALTVYDSEPRDVAAEVDRGLAGVRRPGEVGDAQPVERQARRTGVERRRQVEASVSGQADSPDVRRCRPKMNARADRIVRRSEPMPRSRAARPSGALPTTVQPLDAVGRHA